MNKNIAIVCLSAFISFPITLFGQNTFLAASPKTGTTYKNPVITNDAPDPSVMQCDDGYFYLYSTGESIYRSSNLVSWSYVGSAFKSDNRPTFVSGVNSYWAPDINKIGDKYVLYFAMSTWGGVNDCGVGVATADSPNGPFAPVGNGKLFISKEIGVTNSIDPFYIEDNGNKYIIWGSFYGIYAVQLSDDGLSLKTGAKPVKIAGNAFEGSYVFKRNGYYYYFGSTGSCCDGAASTYKTVYGRATSLLGPYYTKGGKDLMNGDYDVLIHGNDIFVGTGHNAEFMTDKNGDTWILYHAYVKSNPDNGRQVLLDKVRWVDDWPVVTDSQPSSLAGRPVF
jgi:arabinan endo-1,5-alpha-L-arabinosidase